MALFCLHFVLILIGTGAVRCLELWAGAARTVSPGQEQTLPGLISALRWALPAALYGAILLALSYSARRSIPTIAVIPCVFALAVLLGGAIFVGLERETDLPRAALEPPPKLGAPGLLLAQGDAVIVLLDGPAGADGPRVVSLPGRPLIYQQTPAGPDSALPSLPPLPFRTMELPFFMNLAADITLWEQQLDGQLAGGLVPFGIYLGALCLLLVSLRVVFSLSSWPLANLVIGALAFRGVLALETLLNAGETREFIGVFLEQFIRRESISPSIFCVLGLILLLNTVFISLARSRRDRHG